MREEQIIEVIDKLVGGIKPIGETNCDVKAKKNLEVMIELVGHYVDEICEIAQTDSYMASVQDCQKVAHDFIRGLKDAYESLSIVNELAEEHKGGWIPCERGLPETNESVLCWAKSTARGGDVCFVGSCHNGFWFLQSSADIHSFPGQYVVVAWQPLPEEYKEER